MQRFSESWRLMQASRQVQLFRSEAANDEFDGYARYSAEKLAIGNLGGTARQSSSQYFGMMGLFF